MRDVRVIRTKRKTLSLEITKEGKPLVRAPLRLSEAAVDRFIQAHSDWIAKHSAIVEERNRKHPPLTETEIARLKAEARAYLPVRVGELARRFGFSYTGVGITSAETRFGSCSGKNRLNFSYRVMRYSPRAVDYVILHELAHTVEHNHSPRFWQLVARCMPDYREAERELKD